MKAKNEKVVSVSLKVKVRMPRSGCETWFKLIDIAVTLITIALHVATILRS